MMTIICIMNTKHTLKHIFVKTSGSVERMTLYLKLSKVEQTRQLEGAPLVKVDPGTEEVEGESGRHGTEEL